MDSISPIDWAICGCYLALVIGLGLFFSNKQKDNDDFFFGGRNMHWLPVGLSLFATTLPLAIPPLTPTYSAVASQQRTMRRTYPTRV